MSPALGSGFFSFFFFFTTEPPRKPVPCFSDLPPNQICLVSMSDSLNLSDQAGETNSG